LMLYTLGLAAAYSLISYKTPWCLLQFWLGMTLLAGVGAALVTHVARYQWARVMAAILVGSAALQLAGQAWQAGHTFAADRRNPYVYSPTSPDLLKLVAKLSEISQISAEGRKISIKVIASEGDYWPLPWSLRQYTRTGYFDSVPADPYASVIIVSASLHAALDEKRSHVMIGYFELRPGVFLELYSEIKLWREFLSRQPQTIDP
jgi:predicted membrane-bound mannosyltransferase